MARLRGQASAKRDEGRFGLACEVGLRGTLNAGGTAGDFLNGATDDFLVDANLTMGPFLKGAGWQVYKNAVLRRGATAGDIIEGAGDVTFRGTAVAPFLALFDIVVVEPLSAGSTFWPGTTPRFIKRVKDQCERPGSFRVVPQGHWLLTTMLDDMPSGPLQSSLVNDFWTRCKTPTNYYMVGTGPNAYGCTAVDPDETDAWPAGAKCIHSGTEEARPWTSGHNWHLDYRITGFADAIAAVARTQFQTYWKAAGTAGAAIDGYVWHDVLPYYPARGDAVSTNEPTISTATWTAASELIPPAFVNAFGRDNPQSTLWVANGRDPALHTPGATDPQSIEALFYNFQTSGGTSIAQWKADIVRMAGRRTPIIFGSSNTAAPWTAVLEAWDAQEIWDLLTTARASQWEQSTYMGMADRGNGYLWWHRAMREVY